MRRSGSRNLAGGVKKEMIPIRLLRWKAILGWSGRRDPLQELRSQVLQQPPRQQQRPPRLQRLRQLRRFLRRRKSLLQTQKCLPARVGRLLASSRVAFKTCTQVAGGRGADAWWRMLAQTESAPAALVGQRGGLRRCAGTYNEGAIAEWTRAYAYHRRRYALVSCYRGLSELSIVRVGRTSRPRASEARRRDALAT